MYFCEFPPAHRPSVVNQKFSGTPNLTSILAFFFDEQIVLPNGLQIVVRQDWEGDSSLVAHLPYFIGLVGADGDWLDTELLKSIKTALNAP